jgi:hypothetical protein
MSADTSRSTRRLFDRRRDLSRPSRPDQPAIEATYLLPGGAYLEKIEDQVVDLVAENLDVCGRIRLQSTDNLLNSLCDRGLDLR